MLIIYSFCFCISTTYAQHFHGTPVQQKYAAMDKNYHSYQVYQLDANAISDYLVRKTQADFQISLGQEHHWDVELQYSSDLSQQVEQVSIRGGKEIIHDTLSYQVFESTPEKGQSVSLIIRDDFMSITVQKDGQRYQLEPAYFHQPNAPRDYFIFFKNSDKKAKEARTCGHQTKPTTTAHQEQNQTKKGEEIEQGAEKSGCTNWLNIVHVANYTIWEHSYITGLEDVIRDAITDQIVNKNHWAAKIYDEGFDLVLNISKTVIFEEADDFEDYDSNDGNVLYFSFYHYMEDNYLYDAAALWTKKNFYGDDENYDAIGLTRGHICHPNAVLIAEWTSDNYENSILLAHELGHIFGAEHTTDGTIMEASMDDTDHDHFGNSSTNTIQNTIDYDARCLGCCDLSFDVAEAVGRCELDDPDGYVMVSVTTENDSVSGTGNKFKYSLYVEEEVMPGITWFNLIDTKFEESDEEIVTFEDLPPGTYKIIVKDLEFGSTCTVSQQFTFYEEDSTPPLLFCHPAYPVFLENGQKTVTETDLLIDISDNCSTTFSISSVSVSLDCDDLPVFPLNFTLVPYIITATDEAGNTGLCFGQIHLLNNSDPLTAICKDTVFVSFDEYYYHLEPEELDGGTDVCDDDLSFSLHAPHGGPDYNCSDITDGGINNRLATLTVTNSSGETSECQSVITLIDDVAPEITCGLNYISTDSEGDLFEVEAAATDACDNNPSVTAIMKLPSIEMLVSEWTIYYTVANKKYLKIKPSTKEVWVEGPQPQDFWNDVTEYLDDVILPNGIPVAEGDQFVLGSHVSSFIYRFRTDGSLKKVLAPSWELKVSATDNYGNTNTSTCVPTFPGGSLSAPSSDQDLAAETHWLEPTAGGQQEIDMAVYPNPFQNHTRIQFELTQTTDVSLMVYNLQGQQVAQLLQQTMDEGPHVQTWDGTSGRGQRLTPGVYLVRLRAGDQMITRKVSLLRQSSLKKWQDSS